MRNLCRQVFQIKESQCTIISDSIDGVEKAKESITRNRNQLERYVQKNPRFLHSLKPIKPPKEPKVALLMAEAAAKSNVGPMAAVAGVIADLAVEDMTAAGCKVAVVEDGGEVSAMSDRPIDIALAAGDDPWSRKFGFRLTNFPYGLATSSGRFSHALSFGDAEAATVFCENAGLADAAATAVGNVVKGEDRQEALRKGLDTALSILGVEGALILYRGLVGTVGKIPLIIRVTS